MDNDNLEEAAAYGRQCRKNAIKAQVALGIKCGFTSEEAEAMAEEGFKRIRVQFVNSQDMRRVAHGQ